MDEKEDYGKLTTSKLLDVNRKELDAEEEEKVTDEIDKRVPFDYIEETLKELLGNVDDLQRQIRKHDHKDGVVVIKLWSVGESRIKN